MGFDQFGPLGAATPESLMRWIVTENFKDESYRALSPSQIKSEVIQLAALYIFS